MINVNQADAVAAAELATSSIACASLPSHLLQVAVASCCMQVTGLMTDLSLLSVTFLLVAGGGNR